MSGTAARAPTYILHFSNAGALRVVQFRLNASTIFVTAFYSNPLPNKVPADAPLANNPTL